MARFSPESAFLRVLDRQGEEHYVNLAAVAEMEYHKGGAHERDAAAMTITLLAAATDAGAKTIRVVGDDAVALRTGMRRRMGLPEADAPDLLPAPLSR